MNRRLQSASNLILLHRRFPERRSSLPVFPEHFGELFQKGGFSRKVKIKTRGNLKLTPSRESLGLYFRGLPTCLNPQLA